MSNVILFPVKHSRNWALVVPALSNFLCSLGATENERAILLSRLEKRWEQLDHPFQFPTSYSYSGILTEVQVNDINQALQSLMAKLTDHFRSAYMEILIEFAKLEFKLLRLGVESNGQ
jgi:hypothetical protein